MTDRISDKPLHPIQNHQGGFASARFTDGGCFTTAYSYSLDLAEKELITVRLVALWNAARGMPTAEAVKRLTNEDKS